MRSSANIFKQGKREMDKKLKKIIYIDIDYFGSEVTVVMLETLQLIVHSEI